MSDPTMTEATAAAIVRESIVFFTTEQRDSADQKAAAALTHALAWYDAIQRVRDEHRADRDGMCQSCRGWAGEPTEYPCPTIRALDKTDATNG